MHVYIVENNWFTENSIKVFATHLAAVRNFEAQVQEQLEPGTTEKAARKIIKDAVKAERFEYSGDGSESVKPFIVIDSYPVLS